MKKLITTAVLFTMFPVGAFAFSGTEVHITKNGEASVTDVKIMQIAGSTIFCRMYWGDAYVRFTVKTNSGTKFYRATGELTTLSEMAEGNWISVVGTLDSGSDTLSITSKTVKNSSVQKQQEATAGTVSSIALSMESFALKSPRLGLITVKTSSTTMFVKGNRTLDLAHLKEGDTISKISGDYDLPTKTLSASYVLTYLDPNYYKPRNFQGTLQAVNGTTVPTTITVFIEGVTYTVNISEKTAILNKNRGNVILSRYLPGDTIRIWGNIREVDEPIIDNVEIVRNLNL